jgi:formylglycine-generating enzyme required for sulfatase activity
MKPMTRPSSLGIAFNGTHLAPHLPRDRDEPAGEQSRTTGRPRVRRSTVVATAVAVWAAAVVAASPVGPQPTSTQDDCTQLVSLWTSGDWDGVLTAVDSRVANGDDANGSGDRRELVRVWALASLGRLAEARTLLDRLPMQTMQTSSMAAGECPLDGLERSAVERRLDLLDRQDAGPLGVADELLLLASGLVLPSETSAALLLIDEALRIDPDSGAASAMRRDAIRRRVASLAPSRKAPNAGGVGRIARSTYSAASRPGERLDLRLESGPVVELVWVPAGEITPAATGRRTRIEGHWMMRTEVTQNLWEAVMGPNPSRRTDRPDHPVDSVSWFDAVEFANELTRLVALEGHLDLDPEYDYSIRRVASNGIGIAEGEVRKRRTGLGFRLPTEAEWEYACRAGRDTRFAWGDDPADPSAAAWIAIDASPERGGTTSPVGPTRLAALANAWGLYDMHGNVWEWCWDVREGPDHRGSHDAMAPRVVRGGSAPNPVRMLAADRQAWSSPEFTSRFGGFRLCLPGDAIARSGKEVRP